jgi:hypothetical protein
MVEKDKEEAKKEEKEAKASSTVTSASSVTSTKNSKTSTGKPKSPGVPAPKPKEEPVPKTGEKPKPVVPPVQVTDLRKKSDLLPGETEADDEDEDDGEPSDVTPVEVPGGEAQITKEVTENTLAAHNARVELVKT